MKHDEQPTHYSGIVRFLERIVYTVLIIMIVARTPAVNTRDKIGTNNPDPPDVCSWEDTSPENKIKG